MPPIFSFSKIGHGFILFILFCCFFFCLPPLHKVEPFISQLLRVFHQYFCTIQWFFFLSFSLSWFTFFFGTWYHIILTCTGGYDSLFDLSPLWKTYQLPPSSEEFSLASRGTTSGREFSSKSWVSLRSSTFRKVLVTHNYHNPHQKYPLFFVAYKSSIFDTDGYIYYCRNLLFVWYKTRSEPLRKVLILQWIILFSLFTIKFLVLTLQDLFLWSFEGYYIYLFNLFHNCLPPQWMWY